MPADDVDWAEEPTSPGTPRAKLRSLRDTMQTSAEGRAAIASEEGCVLHWYLDEAKIKTGGVGHVRRPGDPDTFDQAIADAWLVGDLRVAESCVNSCVHVAIEQHQFDALSSLAYNIGAGALASSTLVRLLNAGDTAGAADQFLVWCHDVQNGVKVVSPGLLARRKRERAMFLDAGPDSDRIVTPGDVA